MGLRQKMKVRKPSVSLQFRTSKKREKVIDLFFFLSFQSAPTSGSYLPSNLHRRFCWHFMKIFLQLRDPIANRRAGSKSHTFCISDHMHLPHRPHRLMPSLWRQVAWRYYSVDWSYLESDGLSDNWLEFLHAFLGSSRWLWTVRVAMLILWNGNKRKYKILTRQASASSEVRKLYT